MKAAEQRFAPYVENLVSRADLNYILREILGNLGVSHLSVSGGDRRGERKERVGLLGADYAIDHGRYRFARIYTGEHWNAGRQAPLAQPGAMVRQGEYLLAVNRRQLQGADNIYSAFEDLAGKMVTLRVATDPGGADAREVSVKTIYPLGEFFLRYWAWIEDNRRLVEQLSRGRINTCTCPTPTMTATGVSIVTFFHSKTRKP